MRKISITAIIVFAFSIKALTQDSISIKDAAQMRLYAVFVVSDGLGGLLNLVASSDIDAAEMKEVITNSYTDNRNRIFDSPAINIEDDINPNSKNQGTTRDVKLEKYLTDFDVLYTKSNSDKSVVITNVTPSNPKKANDNHLYVKVYFNCLFKNQNKSVDKLYSINNRLAYVKMTKKDNKWTPFIEAISFFNPEDTLNDISNDVQLFDETGRVVGSTIAFSSDTSNEYEALKKRIKDEALENAKREFDAENRKFSQIVEKGDEAVAKADYNGALVLYKQAKDMRPNDKTVIYKIANAFRLQASASLKNDQIYENAIVDANIEQKKRNYPQASKLLKKALSFKPDKSAELNPKIKEMDEKWIAVSELQEQFKAGVNYKDLISSYDKAIKKSKTNSDLYMGRGMCYEKTVNYDRAIDDYSNALTQDASNIAALQLRANLYTVTKENFKALTDYKLYLTNDDTDPAIYEAMSALRLSIKADNFNGAIDDLSNGITAIEGIVDPEKKLKISTSHLYYSRAILVAQKNDFKGAVDDLSKSLLKDSSFAPAHYYRGKNYLALNNVGKASSDFANARRNGLDSQYIRSIQTFSQTYFNRSQKKFNDAAKDSAIILIDYALDITPENSEYHLSKGEYLLSQGKSKEAITSFDNSINLKSSQIEAFYNRGIGYNNLKDYDKAIENFKQAVQLNSKHYYAEKSLADTYFTIANYKSAAENYEKFFLIVKSLKNFEDPVMTSNAYNSMGKSYFRLSEADERALDAFKEAIGKYGNYAEAHFNKGLYYYRKASLSDAISSITKALSIDGKHAEWNYFLAKAYYDKKDFQNAIGNYGFTINKDSMKNFTDSYYFMAKSKFQLQNYKEAVTDYQQVETLGLDTSFKQFDYEVGTAFLNLNMPDSAMIYLDKSYQKDTTNGFTMYAMAIASSQKKNVDQAFTWLEKALRTKQVTLSVVKRDKLMDKLRDEKKFKTLAKDF